LISLGGNVKTEDGIPFPGLIITYTLQNGIGSARTVTDSNGAYSLNDLTPGKFTVIVQCYIETVTPSYPYPCPFIVQAEVEIRQSNPSLVITLPVFHVHNLVVRNWRDNDVKPYYLLFPLTKYPIRLATVPFIQGATIIQAVSYYGEKLLTKEGKTIKNSLVYAFPCASDTNYLAQLVISNGFGISSKSNSFLIASTEEISVDLPKAVNISGVVVNSLNQPVKGVTLKFKDSSQPYESKDIKVVTGNNGNFLFSSVGAGTITLVLDNFGSEYNPNIPSCFSIETILTLTSSLSTLKFMLPEVTTVVVRVVDSDNLPLSGASLSASVLGGGSPDPVAICPSRQIVNAGQNSGCVSVYFSSCTASTAVTNTGGYSNL